MEDNRPTTFPTQHLGIIVTLYASGSNIWAGSNSGGLFKTSSSGTTWTNLTENSDYPAMGISDVAIDPNNSQTLYISTNLLIRNMAGYGIGVLKSVDGGNTWGNTALTFTPSSMVPVVRLGIKPVNPANILYAIASTGIYKTTNGGTTWPQLAGGGIPNQANANFSDIEFKGTDPSRVYFSGREIWMYNETANTWTNLTPGLATDGGVIGKIIMSQGSNSNIYICYGTFTTGGARINLRTYMLNTTTNAWTSLSSNTAATGTTSNIQPSDFVVDPANPNVMYSGTATGGYFFRKTINSGTSWTTPPTSGMHADVRKIVFLGGGNAAGTSGRLLQANDGGVGQSSNAADSWTNINGTGLSATQFFGITVSELNSGRMFGGTQDNGIFWNNNGNWVRRDAGDAYDCVTGATSADNIMCFTNGGTAGTLFRTNDGGGNWAAGSGPGILPCLNDAPIVCHPNNTVYIGKNNVYRTTDWGLNWTQTSNFPTSLSCQKLQSLDVAQGNANVIYTAFSGPTWSADMTACNCLVCPPCTTCLSGKLFKTIDGGTNWTDITIGLPIVRWLGITDLIIHPEDPLKVWVTFGGFSNNSGENRVFYSSNGGSSWSDISSGLPNFPVNCILYIKGSNDALYVGTDVGFFYKDNASGGWQCFQEGLPVGVAKDIEMNYCTQKLKCSLYGRGVWESPLASTNVIQTTIPAGINTVWTGTTRLYGDLIIQANATVTMQGTTIVPKDRKIVIERGGKLIVNGGIITNDCNCMWKGIELWGTRTASQMSGSNYNYAAQGFVEIKNGAIIENARDAISTVKINTNGTFDDNYTGGIILASNSTFRNNRRSTEFRTYPSYNNVSSFINCIFETTAQLKDPATLPSASISLWDVKGVTIRDNTFRCLTTSGYTGTNRGKGIVSLDAQFAIDKTTTGPGNSFTNLDIAVEQGSGGTVTGTNTIRNNTFSDNRHGVYTSGTGTQPYVKENTFLRPFPAVSSPASYGVYTTGTKGITIACNNFSYLTYGNMILSTGTTSDPASLIVDNNFIENFRGVHTQNENTNLQIRYNDFTKSSATQAHWYNIGNMAWQGNCLSATGPAGNKFIGDFPASYKDIYTGTTYNFVYLHHKNDPSGVPLDQVKPEIYQTATNWQCNYVWTPITFCNSGGEEGLMAGGGNGSEDFSLVESFETISGEEPLYGEEAEIAEINDYIYSAGLDSNPQAAIEYLTDLNSEQANWFLAPYYIALDNYEAAAEVLKNLEADDVNKATKLNYFHTITDAGLDGRNLSQFDSSEVSMLDVIADGNSDVRDNARSVLHFFYGRNYPTEEITIEDVPLVLAELSAIEDLVIPNIITPNGDGSNDVFEISNLPKNSSLTIYSSSGVQVYHSDSYANDWPPSTIPAGRYYFSLILSDGTEQNSYFDVVY